MILFFDTETTGLPQKNLSLSHPSQPYIVQLAAILTDDEGTEKESINLIIDNGVPIPEAAYRVHGIDEKTAREKGVSRSQLCKSFLKLTTQSDTIVAHNIDFDMFLIKTHFERLTFISDLILSLPQKKVCTMEASKDLLNLPPTPRMVQFGHTGPKPPRLSELYHYFFDGELEGAHDALVDVRATKDCYFKLKELGRV